MMYKDDFLHLIAEQKMKDMWAEAERMAMVKEAKTARLEAARPEKPGLFRLTGIFSLVKTLFQSLNNRRTAKSSEDYRVNTPAESSITR